AIPEYQSERLAHRPPSQFPGCGCASSVAWTSLSPLSVPPACSPACTSPHSCVPQSPQTPPDILFSRFSLCVLCELCGKNTFSSTRYFSSRVHRRPRQLLRLHPQHFALVRFQHLKPVPFQITLFPRCRNLSAHMAQQSRNRRH